MGLFSKHKDYNLELDEVLDDKVFSSNIKSLLLSMFYKLEICYTDFKSVKRCVRSQEDFLNELIETIRLYCDNIKIVEPDSDQAKMLVKNNVLALTNEKERSILAYPTEQAFLYAISDISPKYFYMSPNMAMKDLIQRTLANGYILNNTEVLRSFTGWSWDLVYEKKFDYISNLIYQNLLVLFGEKFLYEWRTYGSTRKDFLGEFRKYVKTTTGSENYLRELFKLVYLTATNKQKEAVAESLKEKVKLDKKMQNRAEYLEEKKNEKMKLSKKLLKIDKALSNNDLLIAEFNKTNSKLPEEKRFKSIVRYRDLIIKERSRIIKEIAVITEEMEPTNFLRLKQELEDDLTVYKCTDTVEDTILSYNKEFLLFFEKKVLKYETKEELMNAICELRYYSLLKVNEFTQINQIQDLTKIIARILKKIVVKLSKMGAMRIISLDIDFNFEIVKYCLESKMIRLEDVKIELTKDTENSVIISVYDKDVIEKQGRKKISKDSKAFEIKYNRKIKLFI